MRFKVFIVVGLVSIFFSTACSSGTMVFPENEWERSTSEEQGMEEEPLQGLESMVPETTDILVVRNGYIVYEYHDSRNYMKGEREQAVPLYSGTKGITSALVGIAIEDGLIEGIDQKIVDFFPEWKDVNAGWEEITIQHLLTMTSGLKWPEATDWNYSVQPLVTNEDWIHFITDREFSQNPGEVFNYSTGGSHLLSAIIQETTGKTTDEYAREKLFDPLEIEYVEWGEDPQGINSGGEGIWMSAEDLARIAFLYLNNGEWNGNQIVPEDWVEESSKPRVEGWDFAGEYGYHWWISSTEVENETVNYYYAMGFAGQFAFIVPEMDLIAVFTAQNVNNPMKGKEVFEEIVLESIIE